MTKDKARQWDGKSRPPNDLYSKRWDEIFGKKKNSIQRENEEEDNQEYLNSIKEKL
jgi:hypothetical protein